MTALTITPDAAKKRLKTAGKVASGEKVAVTIPGFGAVSPGNLRLRVMFGGVTVGMFPLEDTDEWGRDGESLTCTLNLATEQAERFCKFGVDACVVLEDVGIPQLYGAGHLELLPWIKLAGVDVPVNLDNYKARIGEIETTLSQVHSALDSHVANRENPHAVTKAQVGLGSVDNTSDMAKPVSTAQRSALDAARNEASEAVLAEQSRAIGIETENRQLIYSLQAAKLDKTAVPTVLGGIDETAGVATINELVTKVHATVAALKAVGQAGEAADTDLYVRNATTGEFQRLVAVGEGEEATLAVNSAVSGAAQNEG